MSANSIPPLALGKHDINAGVQGVWTIEIPLNPGESLIGPVTVIAVQPDGTDTPLVGDSLVTSDIVIGQITESPNLWGISFNTEGGSTQTYWLRGAAQRNTTPARGVHRTVRMIAGNN